MKDLKFDFATITDEKEMRKLLSLCQLHTDDINREQLKHFILAKKDRNIVGVIGLEIDNKIGLLRSLAVDPSFRLKGIGKLLSERIIAYSYQLALNEIFLFTKDADKYFEILGFKKIKREDLSSQICESTLFKEYCPDTALCMSKKINNGTINSSHLFISTIMD
jgi:amino-acid N-acetyltransferase